MSKNNLAKSVWSKKIYYDIAAKGSLDVNHPAMKILAKLAKGANQILDMGCGEGTRLNFVARGKECYGIDISSKAIGLAKKKYSKLHFTVGDLETLPYKNESFDLVYSAFVFEHLDNPEKVIKEGIRVLRKGGKFLVVAPNFGAPNRASPPFKGNRIKKLVKGFLFDFLPDRDLSWNRVSPIATKSKYDIDGDTTIEPYLGSLIKFFKTEGLKTEYYSSCWEQELPSAGLLQRMFRFFGQMGIYPFNLWGPHLLIVGHKIN
ncbi:class I SAM-dependent methyltransferase [Patescibacteria group bacterium]|nr:class I SAM-dependent methyltransferase [Patescibacteria group bacterium]